ncbi:Cell cycle checkpoint protein RAD17 [Zostera marina]|uniref:Cell cycle checkpoint protein RAD17 n=1 Tax=Zostera marina TaxID=29655 RepID=A0A0K9P8L7_ZOSMR|nr:Cell cycle checkpoint protein RAD17 [Zostera marina]
MGKRPLIVISSSSDECDHTESQVTSGNDVLLRSSNPKSLFSSSPPVSSRRIGRRSGKRPAIVRSSSDRSSSMVSFESLSDDFYECLNGHHGSRNINLKESWADKYKPNSMEKLAVHKKKVSDIKKWFEDRVLIPKKEFQSNVLLITGQAGVGKSVVVHVLASQIGVELCEWKTPTPTLWQEYVHNLNPGIQYVSKLDEFENFVEHIRKYPILPSVSTGRIKKPVMLLIDDIPMATGKASSGRLRSCLHILARSAHVPTIFLMTEYAMDEGGASMSTQRELVESMQEAGACKVSFKPVTVNAIKKTLLRILREENRTVSEEWIDLIAKFSGGDIRHAITSLQYLCLKPNRALALPPAYVSALQSQGNQNNSYSSFSSICSEGESEKSFSLSFGRDQTLSLFHALGKFLHNKRCTKDVNESHPFHLHEKFTRSPLKMDSPEEIILQGHIQARQITDYLHENVLDFLDDEATEDAWAVSSYLSDADCLLFTGPNPSGTWTMTRNCEPDHISQLIAASVSARGVLFANSQPSAPRWHAIRRPNLWQVEQSVR